MTTLRILPGISIFFILTLVAACGSDAETFDKTFPVQKKYTLKDCVVRLNLEWPKATADKKKINVKKQISYQTKKAISSPHLPFFSSHTTRSFKYYVFYFADGCPDRRDLTEKIIKNYYIPNIRNFPEYTIETKGVTPGFDGVTPSGWWLDGK